MKTPLLVLGPGGWTPCPSNLHVAVNGISSHSVPRGTSGKKKRETEKVQRVEAVEAIVDLIAHARERGDTEIVEKLTRARMCMEDSLRVPYQSEMDWNDTLTSANSLVDVARLHCNIKLEQD